MDEPADMVRAFPNFGVAATLEAPQTTSAAPNRSFYYCFIP